MSITREIEIPFGESVAIPAGPSDPKWISAPDGDLHIRVDGHQEAPLFAGHQPMLITASALVIEPSGQPSRVIVTSQRPAGTRHHDQKAA